MKYIKLGKSDGTIICTQIIEYDYIPKDVSGDEVDSLIVYLATGASLFITGPGACTNFIKEFEEPFSYVMDWTVDKLKVDGFVNTLSFYDSDGDVVFEY